MELRVKCLSEEDVPIGSFLDISCTRPYHGVHDMLSQPHIFILLINIVNESEGGM